MANCPSEIIGVKKIALYINSGARFERPNTSIEDEVNLIVTQSENFLLTDLKSQMKWERTLAFSGNYKQNYFDEFTFLLHGVQNDIPQLIKTLRSNRLGYIIEIITTGNKSLVFQSPVFLNNENTKQVDSHSWNISLSYRIPSFQNNLTLLSVTIGSQPEEIINNVEIVGIQRMALYINEDVVLRHLDPSNENEIALISPIEPFIIINNINQLPKWERIIDNSGNYKQNYIDEFTFLLHGIENDVPGIIQSLRNNRLGYVAEILTTGNKPFIFPSPVFLNEDNTKQIDSHSWNVSLSYRMPSFKDKLILTERPIVEYRNGIVTNSFFGAVAVFDFEAKINSDIQVTFTINWGVDVGTTVINSIMVNGVWKALQTSILIPAGVDPNQTILVTDNFGDGFEVGYVIEIDIPIGAVARWDGGSILDTSGSTNVYNGTLSANPPTLTTGINGEANGAYNFVAANSQTVDFPVITELKNVPALSISTWMKKTAGNDLQIGDLFNSTNGNEIRWFTNDTILGSVRNGATSHISAAVAVGSWTHVCLVFDGSLILANRAILYINNVNVGTIIVNFPTSSVNNSHPFAFGKTQATFSDGQIGPTTLYPRALIPSEVARLFAEKTI